MSDSKKSKVRFVSSLTRPSIKRVEVTNRTEEPCSWDEEEGPHHYQTQCTPVPGHPDLEECEIIKVKSRMSQLVPSNCSKREIKLSRGVEVERTRNGNVVTTTTRP